MKMDLKKKEVRKVLIAIETITGGIRDKHSAGWYALFDKISGQTKVCLGDDLKWDSKKKRCVEEI